MIPWIFVQLQETYHEHVQRHYEFGHRFFANWKQILDAWDDGGIKGIAVGRMAFDDPRQQTSLAWQPNPETYRSRGIEPPPPQTIDPEKERTLHAMLDDAASRGWKILIFLSLPPMGRLPFEDDPHGAVARVAGVQDMMDAFPQVTGHIIDGPGENSYELAFIHGGEVFEVTDGMRESWTKFGRDAGRLERAVVHLRNRFHNLTPALVRYHASGGVLGGVKLFDINDDVLYWLSVRQDSGVASMQAVRREMDKLNRKIDLGGIPRTAAFSELIGQNYIEMAKYFDYIFPKHYFWHRGFDGMYGTLYRWVRRIGMWNPSLSQEDCFAVVKCWFGIELPGIRTLSDFDLNGFPDEFFSEVVYNETRRALEAAGGDTEKVIPWIGTGKSPHHGDPMTAHDLYRILKATEDAGAKRFLFHSLCDLGAPEWSVISKMCGKEWDNDPRRYWPFDTPHPSAVDGGRIAPDED